MSKARLSEMATTWVREEDDPERGGRRERKGIKGIKEILKKKQTFNLRVDTIKRLWTQRVNTSKPISQIVDELVAKYM